MRRSYLRQRIGRRHSGGAVEPRCPRPATHPKRLAAVGAGQQTKLKAETLKAEIRALFSVWVGWARPTTPACGGPCPPYYYYQGRSLGNAGSAEASRDPAREAAAGSALAAAGRARVGAFSLIDFTPQCIEVEREPRATGNAHPAFSGAECNGIAVVAAQLVHLAAADRRCSNSARRRARNPQPCRSGRGAHRAGGARQSPQQGTEGRGREYPTNAGRDGGRNTGANPHGSQRSAS